RSKEKKLAKMKAEEMRVLYVAMTRAKERLILVGSIKDWEKQKGEWAFYQELEDTVLPAYIRSKANSYLSWVGPAVARHNDFLFANYGYSNEAATTKEWTVRIIPNYDYLLANEAETEEHEVVEQEVNEDLVQLLAKRFTTPYPYANAVTKKSKTSVSEQKRLESLQRMEEEQLYNMEAKRYVKTDVPSFMLKGKKERKLSSTEVGTAVHAVMQHIPQQGFTSIEETESYIQSLVDRKLLQQIEADAVSAEKVFSFFQTEVGERFKKAKQVLREEPFTLSLKDQEGDAQIVQGVIDCIFEDEQGNWVLLDYKTDYIDQHL